MKPLKVIILSFVIALLYNHCENSTEIIPEAGVLQYVETNPGGCNNQDFSDLKSATTENDTVYFSVVNDTLNLFTGLNYICCAPFVSSVSVINDSIFVSITDTCNEDDLNCYCRCVCYYTWNFTFSNFSETSYFVKIKLTDPRQDSPITIVEGLKEI
jgi:hypothetical protein